MSAKATSVKGQLGRPVPAEASIETPRNRSRRNTPARGGEPGVRFHMLEPPARAQGRQAAQAGQDGGANIRGGEDREGEEGLLLGNDPPPPPPPPPNRPNPVPRKRYFIAQTTLWKRRHPNVFWCLVFLLLSLLLLVGYISIRSALHHSRLDPALNYVAAPPMTEQEWADHNVEAEKATNKMREKARMAGTEYEKWALF